ncbi:unnamed protein product [Caenorhabditis auriculariae]|uniref:Uncharacterized protein n=1 Tax=Caenorhabditis auriculariae TaxID=2777116 RepID=A0A8S1HB52_9PELO|nr:unnamed protein product [Caenorhabditis auriculariae]
MRILSLLLLIPACLALSPKPYQDLYNSTAVVDVQQNRVSGGGNPTAICRDSDLASFINNSLARYIHDMSSLSTDILNQIKVKKSGTWLVHAEVISNQRQGPDWQSVSNGNIFSGNYYYGCFYHDTQTYILVLRLY